MGTLNIEPIHPEFGAEITGVDLRETPSADVIDEIRDSIDDYSFLCFPDQPFDDDRHIAFTRLFGEPEASHVKLGQEGVIDYLGTIGNVQDDGSVLGNDHQRTRFQTGNNMWHSDSSFREVPTYISIMCVYEVPDEGGQTEFISQRAAYGRLPNTQKETIDPLITIHDYVFSRSKVGPDAVTPSHAKSLPPVQQKLVRRNPRTDAANFFIGSHAREIVGWDYEDSRQLIDSLLADASEAEHVYSHNWQPGDLVIWDNRCLLHRGSGYDADKYRRRMRQSRVQGDGSTLSE